MKCQPDQWHLICFLIFVVFWNETKCIISQWRSQDFSTGGGGGGGSPYHRENFWKFVYQNDILCTFNYIFRGKLCVGARPIPYLFYSPINGGGWNGLLVPPLATPVLSYSLIVYSIFHVWEACHYPYYACCFVALCCKDRQREISQDKHLWRQRKSCR